MRYPCMSSGRAGPGHVYMSSHFIDALYSWILYFKKVVRNYFRSISIILVKDAITGKYGLKGNKVFVSSIRDTGIHIHGYIDKVWGDSYSSHDYSEQFTDMCVHFGKDEALKIYKNIQTR